MEQLDRAEIIKKGYETMRIATWPVDKQISYWKEIAFDKGMQKGKLKGEIKGEISKIKILIELKWSKDQIIPKIKFLNDPKISHKLDQNLQYIAEHLDGYESDICYELDLYDTLLSGSDDVS